MDARRFDALTRSLTATGSRRRLLQTLAGGAAVAAIVRPLGHDDGATARQRRCGSPHDPNETICNGKCVNLNLDENNCGACGHVCPSGQVCSGGACLPCTPLGDAGCGFDRPCCDRHTICCGHGPLIGRCAAKKRGHSPCGPK